MSADIEDEAFFSFCLPSSATFSIFMKYKRKAITVINTNAEPRYNPKNFARDFFSYSLKEVSYTALTLYKIFF